MKRSFDIFTNDDNEKDLTYVYDMPQRDDEVNFENLFRNFNRNENFEQNALPAIDYTQDAIIDFVNISSTEYHALVIDVENNRCDVQLILRNMQCADMLHPQSHFIEFIRYAVRFECIQAANKLINAFEYSTTNGIPILIYLMLSHHEDYIELFCDAQVNVNAVDMNFKTALDIAFDNKNIELCHTLLHFGGTMEDMNRPTPTGDTLLMQAVFFQQECLVDLLCSLKVNVNIINYNKGTSALYYALQNGNKKIFDTLIAHGADINLRNDKGYTPLVDLVIENSEDYLNNFCKWAKPNLELTMHGCGKSALMHAANNGLLKMAKILLEYGANRHINYINENGKTLALLALEEDNLPLLELLHAKNANFYMVDSHKRSLAYHALDLEDLTVIKKLMEWNCYNIEINSLNKNQNTLLMIAARENDEALVYCLLNNCGAQIDIMNNQGMTALHYAIKGDCIALFDFWKASQGIQINIVNESFLMYAARHGKVHWIKRLIEIGDDVHYENINDNNKTPLWYAVENLNSETAKILKKYGARVEHQDINGNTMVMVATQNNRVKQLELLHALGANFNVVDAKTGETAAQYADAHKQYAVLKKLIDCGATFSFKENEDINSVVAQTDKAYNRLQLAMFSNECYIEDVCAVLELKAKVDFNPSFTANSPANQENFTILHQVVERCDVGQIKILAYHHVQKEEMQLYTFNYEFVALNKLALNTLYIYHSKNQFICRFQTIDILEKGLELRFSSSVTLEDLKTQRFQNRILDQIQMKHARFGVENRFFNSKAALVQYIPKTTKAHTPYKYLKNMYPSVFQSFINELLLQNRNDAMYYTAYNFMSQKKNVWYDVTLQKTTGYSEEEIKKEDKKILDLECGLNILYHPVLPREIKNIIWEMARSCTVGTYTPRYSMLNDKQAFVLSNCFSKQLGLKEREHVGFLQPGNIQYDIVSARILFIGKAMESGKIYIGIYPNPIRITYSYLDEMGSKQSGYLPNEMLLRAGEFTLSDERIAAKKEEIINYIEILKSRMIFCKEGNKNV